MLSYVDIAIKMTIGFICLIIIINLSGKGQLAPLSAMDQVGNYVLGGIIGGVIYNPDITVPVSYTHLDVYKRQECVHSVYGRQS